MTYEVNPAQWKTVPFQHQIVGVKFLLERHVALIADEMGSGKTKQFIDTACVLWQHQEIDTLLVVSPASVKSTWHDQLDQHASVPLYVEEYSGSSTQLHRIDAERGLHVIVTNYEFIRITTRLSALTPQLRGRKLMVVFDESSFIKSHKALQTKACKELRTYAKRAYLANGSPINNSLIDLYAPFAVLDKGIINVPNWWAFRNRYCKMGGWKMKQIVGYYNVDELQRKLKPYILRRLKEDCLDLPPKLYNTVEVPLCPETWRIYRELRDDMVAWLDEQTPIMTMHAIVKLVRLSQLTSGMAGGLTVHPDLQLDFDLDAVEDVLEQVPEDGIRVISSEKYEFFIEWLQERIKETPNFRVVLWTRFRKEQQLLEELLTSFTKVLRIYGGQNKTTREDTIRVFNTPASHPVVLISQPRAGGIGLNLQSECSWAVYVSNDYSLLTRQQSEDRIHRSGQRASTVNYLDILATGPNGQKTIDHYVRRALLNKDDFAFKTTAYWRAALTTE